MEEKVTLKSFAAYNKNNEALAYSSSGGIFSVLAESVLSDGGVVFGAAFDQEFKVIHRAVDKKEDLKCIMGSKYVFSSINNVKEEAKKLILDGKKVLFVAAPCQIAALKVFLEKDYYNLITIDFICHGAPDPYFWNKYLKEITAQNGKIKSLNFRKKMPSWQDYKISISFENEQKIKQSPQDNPYMQAFLRNLSLRETCSKCVFKRDKRRSDITIGDFWGVNKVCPEVFNKNGTSLVILNTKKGEEFFKSLAHEMECKEVLYDEATKFNPSANFPSSLSESYYDFASDAQKLTFEELSDKYCKISTSEKVKGTIKRALSMLKK